MNHRPHYFTCFLATLCTAASGQALPENPFGLHPDHPYRDLSMAYETPHVKWANPYAGGTTRALVLAPMWAHRETVELAQRLSLEFTPWMCKDYFQAAPEKLEFEASFFFPPKDLLLQHLSEYLAGEQVYDVVIIGKLDWSMLPAEQRAALLEKVFKGTGLVYVHPPREHPELDAVFHEQPLDHGASISTGVPIEALPRFARLTPEELIKTSRYGKGRVVRLTYDEPDTARLTYFNPSSGVRYFHSLTPRWVTPDYSSAWTRDQEPQFERFHYDYYHSLVAKAVVWAAGREPHIRIAGCDLHPSINQKDLKGEKLSLRLERHGDAPESARVELVVRNTHGETALEKQADASFNENKATIEFNLPVTSTGEYVADFRIVSRQNDHVINWGSFVYTVSTDIEIQEIQPARKSMGRGHPIAARVTPSRSLREGETVVASLWDSLGRKIIEGQGKEENGSFEFAFGRADPEVIMHEIRAAVVRAGDVVTESRLMFPIRKGNDPTEYTSILWSEVKNNYINYAMLRKLRDRDEGDAVDVPWTGLLLENRVPSPLEAGMLHLPETDLEIKIRNLGLADLKVLAYNYRFGVLGGDEQHRLVGKCFSDPQWLEEIADAFTRDAEIYGPYGPLAWTHGDETLLSEDPDVCWTETCLKAFKQFLRSEYDELDALNASWSSHWKNWDEILPGTYEEARESRNFPPWIDHKRSMSVVFSGLFDHANRALQTGDPGARSGFDGSKGFWRPNGAVDWWRLCKSRGVLQTYNETGELEVFRSFADPDSLRGAWYGSYGANFSRPTSPEASHYILWNSLFNQANSSWFWTMGGPGPLSGYAPDLTSLPFFQSRTDTLREIKLGIDKLLLTAARQNDHIAIHYSDSSKIAESLFTADPDEDSRPFVGNYQYVCHLLEANGLQYDFVAYEQVEQGMLQDEGFNILYMPYSRAISRNEAANIRRFVQDGGIAIADLVPGTLDEHGKKQTPGLLEDLFGPATEPSDTASLDEFTVRVHGKGKAVLIGDRARELELSPHGRARNFVEKLRPHLHAFAGILNTHTPVRPRVSVVASGETTNAPPTVIRRFTLGEIEYVTLLRFFFSGDNLPYPFTISFDRESHLYDVRGKKYLGRIDQIEREISHTAHIYALSPYRVMGLGLEANAASRQGDPLDVSLELSAEDPGRDLSTHVIRLKIVGPDGQERRHYAQSLIAENGACSATVPFALNDPRRLYPHCAGRDERG